MAAAPEGAAISTAGRAQLIWQVKERRWWLYGALVSRLSVREGVSMKEPSSFFWYVFKQGCKYGVLHLGCVRQNPSRVHTVKTSWRTLLGGKWMNEWVNKFTNCWSALEQGTVDVCSCVTVKQMLEKSNTASVPGKVDLLIQVFTQFSLNEVNDMIVEFDSTAICRL